MSRVVSLALVVAAIIHLLPLTGILGSERLTALYGISFDEPNIEILMRHRAVLFGLLGSFLLYAAFKRSMHLVALVAGLISVISFLYIAWSVGGYNSAVARVFSADLVALACLLLGAIMYALQAVNSK